MKKDSKILVTGCQGMAGWAVIRELQRQGYTNYMGVDRADLDLLDYDKVNRFFEKHKPEYIFHVAAKVGGIRANDTRSAEFIYENLTMQNNVIHLAHKHNVEKMLFCGSACIYPKNTEQPIKEEYLLTGELEETNKAYAVAKIAGVIMSQMYRKQYGCNFISVMPTNLYGIGDNFHLTESHVIPALIRKFHDAVIHESPQIEIWGNPETWREFLYIDDLADGLIYLMCNYNEPQQINIGTGVSIQIHNVVDALRIISGYKGAIVYTGQAVGVIKRELDIIHISNLGWAAKIHWWDGLRRTFNWFVDNYNTCRK